MTVTALLLLSPQNYMPLISTSTAVIVAQIDSFESPPKDKDRHTRLIF